MPEPRKYEGDEINCAYVDGWNDCCHDADYEMKELLSIIRAFLDDDKTTDSTLIARAEFALAKSDR